VKRKVLLVDDEVAFTRMTKINLDRSGNYETHIVNDSTQAVAAVKKNKPDIIFLDVMMPGLDGGEVASLLREDPELSNIPIVFLTAIVSKEEIAQDGGSQIGGNEFLAKPIKIHEMIETIERMLGD